ncbi:GntR family transcriptional regulator [Microbacterium aoyamense]|uniref:GntR family transcriptional regulator n=1 Tax=Microbacterium aoyamense TaxID=344166 RepID=A0ABP5AVV5_9MICO|nr:GntR family transcriptional regulator [Microbacterium aoyamense]
MNAPSPALTSARAEPVWQRAAHAVERRIGDGTWPHGTRLPSERELCIDLDVSRVTLRRALNDLERHGLISARRGRGWFVGVEPEQPPSDARAEWPNSLESFTETAARLGLEASSRVTRSQIAPATLDEAEQLQVVAGMPLLHLDRIRSLGGIPVLRDCSRVPVALVPQIESVDFAHGSMYAVLSAAGSAPAYAETTLEARAAEPELAVELSIEPGSAVLVMKELARAADGRPVLASEIHYAGERYRLRTVFARTSAH